MLINGQWTATAGNRTFSVTNPADGEPIGEVVDGGRDEAVAAQQVTLQTLISEEAELTLLTVERRPVIDHLGVNLDLKSKNMSLRNK